MSTTPAAFVSMFDPDGNVRSIPQDQMQAALGSGGKLAVRMIDPNGVKRWIPHDQVFEALRNQGKIAPDEPLPAHQSGIWESIKQGFGIPTTPEESQQFLHSLAERARQNMTAGPIGPNPTGLLLPTPAESVAAVRSVAPKVATEAKETVSAVKRGDLPATYAHTAGTLGYGAATLTAPLGGTQMVRAGEQLGAGDVKGGLTTAGTLIAPFVAGAAMGGKAPKIAPEASHIEALTGLIDDRAGAVNPHETATTALPVAREQAVKMGINPKAFEGRKGGELVTGKDGVLNRAIQEHRAQYAEIKKPFLGEQMDATPIAQAYLDKITPEMLKNDPGTAAKLRAEASKFAVLTKDGRISGPRPMSLEEMNDFRERMNRELTAFEQKGVGQQIMSDTEVKANAAAADAARDQLYKTLGRLSGKGEDAIRTLKTNEGALIETRNSLTKEFNKASGAQGAEVSRTVREKVAGTYPSPRGVGHKTIKEVLGPKPLSVFNNRLKQMFADLPEKGTQAPSQTLTPPTGGTSPLPAPGGHAGGGVASAEELSRPGLNYVVSKSGGVTYHGKSFAPESTAAGSTHVTSLPDGTFRVNAGPALTPTQEAALRKAVPTESAKPAVTPERRASAREHPYRVWSGAERVIRRAGLETDPSMSVNKDLGTITFWEPANPNRVAIMRIEDIERGGVEAVKQKMAERAAGVEAKARKGQSTQPAARPAPTMPSPALQPPQGLSKASQATLVMLAAKEGSITQQEANRRIQRLVGNGGTRTIRRPSQSD